MSHPDTARPVLRPIERPLPARVIAARQRAAASRCEERATVDASTQTVDVECLPFGLSSYAASELRGLRDENMHARRQLRQLLRTQEAMVIAFEHILEATAELRGVVNARFTFEDAITRV